MGDIVKIEETPRFNENKNHAVAEMIKRADRFVDPKTKFVYTNGHLHIPVGYSEMDEGGKEIIRNRIPKELYVKMGLL